MSLRLSSKLSPFPYASLGIAAYTANIVEIVYDEELQALELDLNGSKLTSESEIVHAIARAANLADDSAKAIHLISIRISS